MGLRTTWSSDKGYNDVMRGSIMKQFNKILLRIFLGVILSATLFKSPSCFAADLLTNHDWRHFTGATVTESGIEIMPVNRMIVPKVSVPRETDDQDVAEMAKRSPTPNPPINLRGPMLQVQGDFTISIFLEISSNKGAYLDLYGTLPVIYDEWRQEGKALRVGVKDGALLVSIWNGRSSEPITKTFGEGMTDVVEINVTRLSDNFVFQVNGKTVGKLRDPGLFNDGSIVFGADAEKGGGFIIRQLTAQALNTASKATVIDREPWKSYGVMPNSLRFIAAARNKPLYIGAAVAAIPLVTDEKYQSLVGQEFNMITPENDMKFQFIHPGPNLYAFNEADSLVEFAQHNNIRVHGHALVWHEALPTWVTGVKYSPSEVKLILSDHIRTVVGHYKGRVAEWDVVNEPLKDRGFNTDKGLRAANPWFQAMGEEYIDFAFREAHEVDSNARLYLNEYGIEEPGEKFDALYALVKRLLARGVPIHGIGFQMHEDMESGKYVGAQPDLVAVNMQKMANLGLEVRVSEMDVNMNAKSTPRRLNEQARAFAEMLTMSVRQDGLKSFGQWGVTDRYSSLAPMFEYFQLGNGLLFDADYQRKPTYYRMKEILANVPE
ncbi:MAG: Endo,4-beta-xylanase [Pelosinus sp.]|nr:Endo,4-beta-xylanase [Pelosinus sp.]